MVEPTQTITKALAKLLRPLIRLLLRNGVTFAEFSDCAKRVFVEVANDIPVEGRKQSMSRIAVLTGIHRHEVGKILKAPREALSNHSARHNRSAKVITGWQQDEDFSIDGKARRLDLEEEFSLLVSRHAGDVTPRSMLDELQRVGAASLHDDNHVELRVTAFSPANSMEDLHLMLGDAAADLLATLDHNLTAEPDHKRLQLAVSYNNLPDDVLRNLELICRDRTMEYLTELNRFMATQDRDTNPTVEGEGRNRAGVGVYFFKENVDSESNS